MRELTVDRGLLEALADPAACRFDHDGTCQEHNTAGPGRCPQGVLAELLARSPVPATTAAKVLTVVGLDEYFVTDDEQDLIEVLISDAQRTDPEFTDEVLVDFARACRLAVTLPGIEQIRALAAEAGR